MQKITKRKNKEETTNFVLSDCCWGKYDSDRKICLECGEHSGPLNFKTKEK